MGAANQKINNVVCQLQEVQRKIKQGGGLGALSGVERFLVLKGMAREGLSRQGDERLSHSLGKEHSRQRKHVQMPRDVRSEASQCT